MDILEKIRSAAFADAPPDEFTVDLQGWMQEGFLKVADDTLSRLLASTGGRPLTVVEVGTWKGLSAAYTAKKMIELGAPAGSGLIAVDPFLGSYEHQGHIERDASGRPSIWNTFRWNMRTLGLQDIVYPFPIPSLSAAEFFRHNRISVDMVYVDGAHEYLAVKSDLLAFWEILRPGGAMLIDDYASYCEGVVKAVDEFVADKKLRLDGAGVTVRVFREAS